MAVSARSQTIAIIWAQWRSFINRSPLLRRSFPLTGIVMALWYGLWALAAFTVGSVCATEHADDLLDRLLIPGLLLVTLYWQLIPILMASAGAGLDLRRLIVYPVPHRELFRIEVALRVTSALEMLLISIGAGVGLLFNPTVPRWGGLAFVPFILFNLFLASALRDMLQRLMGRKHVRELVILCIVLISALPQVVVATGISPRLKAALDTAFDFPWPWVSTGRLALGANLRVGATSAVALLLWCAAAWLIARRQFERSLTFSAGEMRSRERAASRAGLTEWLYKLPGALLPDPLAAMVEKDVRALSRSPRFRLVFIMGFTFGLVIWLPLAFGGDRGGWMKEHYLTVATGYAVMLLAEVVIWNSFGFDRRAAQVYFVMPVRLTQVLVAKNLGAAFFITLDTLLITAMCAILQLPITPELLGETAAVVLVLTLLLVSIGNLLSTRNPRPVDPDQSWGRTSAGRVQAALLLLYPVLAGPIALAFLARHAFDTDWAFYGVMLFNLAVACIVYWIALESAVETAYERRDEIIGALSREQGLLS
jgi:ABC-2 type transport system permease protein